MTPGGAFRVLVNFRIDLVAADEFERAWSEVAAEVEQVAGYVGQWLMCDYADPSSYYIMSEWTDRDSFLAFEAGARHERHKKLLRPFRLGGSFVGLRVRS